MTPAERAELKRVAEAAPQKHKWEYDGTGTIFCGSARIAFVSNDQAAIWGRDTAKHIATFDPPTVLALLADVERLERAIGDCPHADFSENGRHWLDWGPEKRNIWNPMHPKCTRCGKRVYDILKGLTEARAALGGE